MYNGLSQVYLYQISRENTLVHKELSPKVCLSGTMPDNGHAYMRHDSIKLSYYKRGLIPFIPA